MKDSNLTRGDIFQIDDKDNTYYFVVDPSNIRKIDTTFDFSTLSSYSDTSAAADLISKNSVPVHWNGSSFVDGEGSSNLTGVSLNEVSYQSLVNRTTGDANISGATGDANISGATGDANISEATGDANISVATGDANISGATGDANISEATGDANISEATGASNTSGATGASEVAQDSNQDLISLDQVSNNSPGTQYSVYADVGNGREEFTLVFKENGDYDLRSSNGQVYTRSDVVSSTNVEVRTNASRTYYSNTDDYSTLNTTGDSRVNGVESYDNPDNHDHLMHHTHTTQTIGLNQNGSYSELDAINRLSGTNQRSVQDAEQYYQDMLNNGDIVNPEQSMFNAATYNGISFFEGTEYSDLLTELEEGQDLDLRAEQLSSDVEQLQNEFNTLMSSMVEWSSNSSDEAKRVIDCILGKFEVTMGNINLALTPAMLALKELLEKLKELKKKDADLQLLYKEKRRIELLLSVTPREIAEESSTSVMIRKASGEPQLDNTGRPMYQNVVSVHYVPNPRYAEREAELANLLELQIDPLLKEIEKLIIEILKRKKLIENYEKAVKQFSSFVNPGGSNYHMVSSKQAILDNHHNILEEFENFDKMPVITNLTDYKVGDYVRFDDSYGNVYKVIKRFNEDGIGYLVIIAVDQYGNPIEGAEPIRISDAREIVPIKYGYTPWTKTPVEDTPEGGAPYRTPPPTNPPSTDPPPTNPPPTNPPPTDPPSTDPPSTDPPPTDPPPTNPPPTDPPSRTVGPEPTLPPSTEPFIPHTGLDSIGSVSKSGVGTMAGMAFGAAGLGLASMFKDNDEKKEENESKEEN